MSPHRHLRASVPLRLRLPALLLLAPLALPGLLGCARGEKGFLEENADAALPGDATSDPVAPADDATLPATGMSAEDDAGLFPAADDAAPTAIDDATAPVAWGPPFDAGEGGLCPAAIAPGSLAIVEIMIESTSGTGDHGEWLEIESTVDCAMNLRGLLGDCPVGTKVITFSVPTDLWLPGHGTFVLADSTDEAINHDLPGTVLAWSGNTGDVLRNEGATVTLLYAGPSATASTLVDSVTYPSLKLTPGESISFPSDCPLGLRSTWSSWHVSAASWFPGFLGTPNAPNGDVHCPDQGDL